MSIIITSVLLPSLSPLLKNLWNGVFGVSYSFQFSRKSSEMLWVWMAVIYATQPVHWVKLNCLFFTDSMDAWWLCRLFLFFLRRIDYIEFCHSWAATSLQQLHLLLRLTCITASQASQVHSAYTAIPLTTFLFIVSHSNLPQQHQWRIHIMNIIIKISESTLSGVLINSGRKHILTQTLVCLTSTHSQSLPHVHGISVAVECAMRQPMLWSLTLPSGAFKEAPLLSRYLTLLLLFHSTNTQAPITNWAADTH